MKLIIAGSRTFSNKDYIYDKLNEVYSSYTVYNIDCVIVGGCKGVDTIAEEWAIDTNILVKKYLADWNQFGKAAGPIRNKEMVKQGTHLIVFHQDNSKGTANIINQALEANLWIKVYKV